MKVQSLQDLLLDQLKDLYSAETQLTKALPKMAKAASSDALREALQHHLEETQGQVEKLDEISRNHGMKLTGKKCKAMEGLIAEGKEALDLDAEEPFVDLAIIAAAQRVEHYEISGYGTARTLAEHLGLDDIARTLREIEEQEAAADKKLTQVTLDDVLVQARDMSSGEEEEEDTSRSRSNSRKGSTRTTQEARR